MQNNAFSQQHNPKTLFFMQFNNWSLQNLFCPKHTFSPKDLNIYHWHFEKSEKQGFRLNFVLNFSLHEHLPWVRAFGFTRATSTSMLECSSRVMNIMTIAHSSELNNFLTAVTSKREHILKIPMLTIWIFRLRFAVPQL